MRIYIRLCRISRAGHLIDQFLLGVRAPEEGMFSVMSQAWHSETVSKEEGDESDDAIAK